MIQVSSKKKINFNLLQKSNAISGNRELGGEFTLPPEFDLNLHVGNFVLKGAGVAQAKSRQHILGTDMTADGWTLWQYPDEATKRDEEGAVIYKDKKPLTEKHPNAGQPFEVIASGKTFVLMFRGRDVQTQVNEVCGLLSRERMLQEIRGETVGGTPTEQLDPSMGMVPDRVLNKNMGQEKSAEDWQGETTVVAPTVSNKKHLGGQTRRVTR